MCKLTIGHKTLSSPSWLLAL